MSGLLPEEEITNSQMLASLLSSFLSMSDLEMSGVTILG